MSVTPEETRQSPGENWQITVLRSVNLEGRLRIKIQERNPYATAHEIGSAFDQVVPNELRRSSTQGMSDETINSYVRQVELMIRHAIDRDADKDLEWACEQESSGAFSETTGAYLAIYNQRIVGEGYVDTELRDEVAREQGVSPDRIVVIFRGEWH